MRNKVSVISVRKGFKKFESRSKDDALKILKILKQNDVFVEIFLAGDKEMKTLNKKFRNKDKTANVLSFNEPKNFVFPPSAAMKTRKIGEVYLNVEQTGPKKMFSSKHLLAHAILHLLGYSHNDKMEKKERFLISKI